jgi:hypothetical protein
MGKGSWQRVVAKGRGRISDGWEWVQTRRARIRRGGVEDMRKGGGICTSQRVSAVRGACPVVWQQFSLWGRRVGFMIEWLAGDGVEGFMLFPWLPGKVFIVPSCGFSFDFQAPVLTRTRFPRDWGGTRHTRHAIFGGQWRLHTSGTAVRIRHASALPAPLIRR